MSTFESQSVSELEAELKEQELLGESGQEAEAAYSESEDIWAGRMLDPTKVDCAKLNRSLPIFRAIRDYGPAESLRKPSAGGQP